MLVREEQLLIQHLRCPVVRQWSHISWLIFPLFHWVVPVLPDKAVKVLISVKWEVQKLWLSDNTFGELERLQRTHQEDAEKLETSYQKLTTASEMILRLVKAHDSQAEQIAHSVRENECLARDHGYRRSLNHKSCRLEIGCRQLYDSFSTLWEIKKIRISGEYGRKAET